MSDNYPHRVTIACMAANIAAGMLQGAFKPDPGMWAAIVQNSVQMARDIAAETIRTEPEQPAYIEVDRDGRPIGEPKR